jgi:hypothetical protein
MTEMPLHLDISPGHGHRSQTVGRASHAEPPGCAFHNRCMDYRTVPLHKFPTNAVRIVSISTIVIDCPGVASILVAAHVMLI